MKNGKIDNEFNGETIESESKRNREDKNLRKEKNSLSVGILYQRGPSVAMGPGTAGHGTWYQTKWKIFIIS